MQNLINEIKNNKILSDLNNSDKNVHVLEHYFVTDYKSVNKHCSDDVKHNFIQLIDNITKKGDNKEKPKSGFKFTRLIKYNNTSKSIDYYRELYLGKNLEHFKENLNIYVDQKTGHIQIESSFQEVEKQAEFNKLVEIYKEQYPYFDLYSTEAAKTNFKYFHSRFHYGVANLYDISEFKKYKNHLNESYKLMWSNLLRNSLQMAFKIGEEYFHYTRGEFFKTNTKYKQTDTLKLITENQLSFYQSMYLIGKLHCKTNIHTNTTPEINVVTFNSNKTIELDGEFEDTLLGKYGNDEYLTTIKFQGEILKSKFNDFQAFHICKGLKNQQFLYDLYSNGRSTLEHRYKAHQLANSTLEKYGKAQVDFILSLPTLPFKTERFNVLFSKLDKMRYNIELPSLRFTIKDTSNNDQNIEVEFLVQNGNVYKNQLRVRNTSTNQTMFNISREGKVKLEDNLNGTYKNRNITPVIQLFYQMSKNEYELNNAILAYGIASGKCSICGRTLTDELSKLEGIGPICKQYLF